MSQQPLSDVPAAIAARQLARVHLGAAHDDIVRALVAINHDQDSFEHIEAALDQLDGAMQQVLSL